MKSTFVLFVLWTWIPSHQIQLLHSSMDGVGGSLGPVILKLCRGRRCASKTLISKSVHSGLPRVFPCSDSSAPLACVRSLFQGCFFSKSWLDNAKKKKTMFTNELEWGKLPIQELLLLGQRIKKTLKQGESQRLRVFS